MPWPPATRCDNYIGQPAHAFHKRANTPESLPLNCLNCAKPLLVLEFGERNEDPQKHTYRKRYAVALHIVEWP